MRFSLPAGLCVLGVCVASSALGQGAGIQPVRATAGTVLTFHLQTRLNPAARNVLDSLPKGTELRVRLLESIDSSVDRDGFEFRGSLTSPLMSGNEVIVRADAEVRGLLVLLRSRNHPGGFRYELLLTHITEKERIYDVTASLNPSLIDSSAAPAESANANPVTGEGRKERQGTVAKTAERQN